MKELGVLIAVLGEIAHLFLRAKASRTSTLELDQAHNSGGTSSFQSPFLLGKERIKYRFWEESQKIDFSYFEGLKSFFSLHSFITSVPPSLHAYMSFCILQSCIVFFWCFFFSTFHFFIPLNFSSRIIQICLLFTTLIKLCVFPNNALILLSITYSACGCASASCATCVLVCGISRCILSSIIINVHLFIHNLDKIEQQLTFQRWWFFQSH